MIKPNKNLILIKSEDRTDNIVKCNYCDWKTYKYGYTNLICYKDPKETNLRINMVMKKGIDIYVVVQMIKL